MKTIAREIGHHLPYSILSVLAGMLFVVTLSAFNVASSALQFFHVFHPVHMLLSATATTAMFWIHDKRWLRAAAVGLVGSLGPCSISDYGLPYLGGLALGVRVEAHFCLVQHPALILPFALIGVVCGMAAGEFVKRSTFYSHSSHVLVSSMASMLYLVSFGVAVEKAAVVGWTFLIVLVSVMVSCCFSDIIFPLLFVKPEAPSCRCHEGH